MKSKIELFQEAYYNGNPLITDEQYDQLVLLLGEESIGPGGDIEHLNPMYSLDKVYPSRGDKMRSTEGYIESNKFDGCAIELVYERVMDGVYILHHMCTRGNVSMGKTIAYAKHTALSIPVKLNLSQELTESFIQITGEVISTKDVPNARNMVGGALNKKDLTEFYNTAEALGMVFVAYNITLPSTKPMGKFYTEDLDTLDKLGFLNVLTAPEKLSTKPMVKLHYDGVVYRLNNNEEYYNLGFTAKAPRGAFAVKQDADFVVTKLLDVEWNVGRTGKVVPTAILEPVDIDGATISRATLNNPVFIEEMGLYTGCMVKVIRSGEIIPCIIGLFE